MTDNIWMTYENIIAFDKFLSVLLALVALALINNGKKNTDKSRLNRGIIVYVVFVSVMTQILGIIGVLPRIFGTDGIHRGMMLIPQGIILAYVITISVSRINDKKEKVFSVLMCIMIAASSGSYIFSDINVYDADNTDNVYDTGVDIAKAVTKENETPYIAISNLQGVFIRQYDANIKTVGMNVSTEKWYEESNTETVDNYDIRNALIGEINSTTPNMEALLSYVKILDCDYVVCLENYVGEYDYAADGFRWYNVIDGFLILENIR